MTKSKTPAVTKAMPPAARLHANQAKRAATIAQDTAKLAMIPPRPEQFTEAMDLGQATLQRMNALQKSWAADWADWATYAGALSQADTMPKYLEHAGNILLRAQAQMTAQMNDLSNLSENASVSYGYWVAKQVENSTE